MLLVERLPAALRARGLHVIETADWLRRGYNDVAFEGQMNHHTAISGPCTPSTAQAMIRGRSDLQGPLCNAHGGLGGDGKFVVYLIAGQRARHAGPGSATVLAGVRRDVAPTGDARDRGLKDDLQGANRAYFGWEWQHPGDASPWPPALLDGIGQCNAALAELAGWTAARSIHHREHTARKIDMSWRGDLRALVAEKMENDVPLTKEDLTAIRDTVRAELNRATAQPDGNPFGGGSWATMTGRQYERVVAIEKELAEIKATLVAGGGGTGGDLSGTYEVTRKDG